MQMRSFAVTLGLLPLLAYQAAAMAADLCKPLRSFVESVKPDESRALEFHTSWGSDFKDSTEAAIYAKRCIHHGYAPARAVCAYLMEHGAVEFSGNNAKAVVSCLSPKTRFAPKLLLDQITLSLSYGTEDRGANIDISLLGDEKLGGMVLTIEARGY
jgi:hypothetical protein